MNVPTLGFAGLAAVIWWLGGLLATGAAATERSRATSWTRIHRTSGDLTWAASVASLTCAAASGWWAQTTVIGDLVRAVAGWTAWTAVIVALAAMVAVAVGIAGVIPPRFVEGEVPVWVIASAPVAVTAGITITHMGLGAAPDLAGRVITAAAQLAYHLTQNWWRS